MNPIMPGRLVGPVRAHRGHREESGQRSVEDGPLPRSAQHGQQACCQSGVGAHDDDVDHQHGDADGQVLAQQWVSGCDELGEHRQQEHQTFGIGEVHHGPAGQQRGETLIATDAPTKASHSSHPTRALSAVSQIDA
jgi:hypothetical protein